MTILVIAEHDNASPQGRDPEYRRRRRKKIGGDIHVLVAGASCAAAAQQAAGLQGVASRQGRRCSRTTLNRPLRT